MIVIILGLSGAFFGWSRGQKTGGKTVDKIWRAGVGAIVGMIAGLFLTIGIERLA